MVYARVSLAHKDMEPELECFDAQTHKAEGFGELKGGFLVRCSLKMCRQCVPPVPGLNDLSFSVFLNNRLLDPQYFLLPLLGSKFPLDAATGVNGRVWINSKDPKHIIATVRCIEKADPDGDNLDANGVKRFLGALDV